MNFKYHDLLSSLVTGVVVCISVNIVFELNLKYDVVPLLAVAYVIGYFINALSALCEKYFYKLIGGIPSDVLLTPIEGQSYTGYKRIKFYQTGKVVSLLKIELNDQNADCGKMFSKAMSYSNGDKSTRVPDFNAQYVFSRVLLTVIIILTIIWSFNFYRNCLFWLMVVITFYLAFRRCKELGFYYAREVLIEYIHKKEVQNG